MTPERWQRIKDVLSAALHRPAQERVAAVADACGGDVSLHREVSNLLSSHAEMGSFLAEPLFGESSNDAGEELPEEIRKWERFQVLEKLGSGGMAAVYKGWDPRLQRFIAIKLITRRDPLTVKRFLREAEAQARVDHENVLKVYETGVAGACHYIAMQYVNGPTLSGVRDETTLDQKVELMIRIAEGLHAAHRDGLVHRDIKPSNILVERKTEGLQAYLLDFGLAIDAGSASLTETGAVIGTPRYMAPERIRGGTAALDRRSDIYSIGATFYELIAGVPPFAGSTSLQVLVDVMERDVTPLRSVRPAVPAEIDAIIMKCVERDPARRYPSARALAEDLRRYLDGEPVLARPSGLVSTLGKKARRHPRLTIAFAALLLLIAISGGWGAYTTWRASKQTELARMLGHEVRNLEWLFRVGQMSPLHPIEPHKRQLRLRIRHIGAIMNELGSLAFGPGHYAQGRGFLTLGEHPKALAHLQRAWAAGHRTPDAAAALGLTHSAIFREELAKAQRIDRPRNRELRVRDLQKAHRDPALRLLREGRSTSIMPPLFIDALIASLQGDVPGALDRADKAARETPWLFEARLLQGHLQRDQAVKSYFRGEPQALEMAARADRHYEQARIIAGSAIDPHLGRCAVAGLLLHMGAHDYPADVTAAYRQANASCASALVVEPHSAEGHRLYAEAVDFWANLQVQKKVDPGDAYARAASLAERAVHLSGGGLDAILTTAEIHLDRAWWEIRAGKDPRAAIDQAVAVYEKALAIDPRSTTGINNIGMAFDLRSRYERANGRSATESLNRSITSYQRSLRVDSQLSFSFRNLARTSMVRADEEYRQGIDPTAGLQQVLRFLEQLPGDPSFTPRAAAVSQLRARVGEIAAQQMANAQ